VWNRSGRPGPAELTDSHVAVFGRWAAERHGLDLTVYDDLWAFSVHHPEKFWADVATYFDVRFHSPWSETLANSVMPGARWCHGATLNYVEQVFADDRGTGRAVVGVGEDGRSVELSWPELRRQVAALAHTLRGAGVGTGDRVVGYLPDIVETVVAFLATASIGAVWASCGQEYPAAAAADRLGQLQPIVLIAANGYRHSGRVHQRSDASAALRAQLPTVSTVIAVDRLGTGNTEVPDALRWDAATEGEHELELAPVLFDHPLWVLFSSGTTGTPKGIVHGHGGIVLEHLKNHAFHLDLGVADTFFWYTSPSWTMGICKSPGCCSARRSFATTAAPPTRGRVRCGGPPPNRK